MSRKTSTTNLATLFFGLVITSTASAAPCGDVALEGQCNGSVREYCNAGELQSEACEACCGWDGDRYDCIEACPSNGDCIEECLDGVNVFGCSLLNTHEWTCEKGPAGCTVRVFSMCSPGEICDESSTNACRPTSEVDLCSGIGASGECKGSIFKRCIDGQLVSTDCSGQGKACTSTGCANCSDECIAGDTGCESSGKSWDCVPSAVTNCLVRVAKNCSGGKQCFDGRCVYVDDMPQNEAEPSVIMDAGSLNAVADPAAEAATSGCQTSGWAPDTMRDGLLAVMSTLLGFLLFTRIARRRD